MDQKKIRALAIILLLAIILPVYFSAMDSNRFCFYHDDGIYLVTAKSLATGQGYRIISLPGEPWQTKYPPVFPLALSVLWRINPEFPSNLPLFTLFTILCMIAFLVLAAIYLIRHRYASNIEILLALLFASLNWRTIILATSLLSEALYAALAVCALLLAASNDENHRLSKNLALGICLGLATLTRLTGISLVAAILLHSLIRKQFSRILPAIILASTMIAGWFLWSHLHQISLPGSYAAYYTNYFQDWHFMLLAGKSEGQTTLLTAFPAMLGKNVLALMANIPIVCLGALTDWYKGLGQTGVLTAILLGFCSLILLSIGFWKSRLVAHGLLHFYFLAYLGMHIFWPYSLYDRFLIPVLPFALLFIILGSKHLLSECFENKRTHCISKQTLSLAFSGFILICLFSITFFRSTVGLFHQMEDSRRFYAEIAQENSKVISWLKRQERPDQVATCYEDPLYYLGAGRKAVRFPAGGNDESAILYAQRLKQFVNESKATILLRTPNDFSLEVQPARKRELLANALRSDPKRFIPIFESDSGHSTIYRLTSDVAGNTE